MDQFHSCLFRKIIGKYQRLYELLDFCDILYLLQFGFREKHSTNHALISMTEAIKFTVDKKRFGCDVFDDLKETTFDTVNHAILLKELEHYGVRGIALGWFSSYLLNREQFVSVKGQISEKRAINCGVPQGSVGFREKHSTNHALISMTEAIKFTIDIKKRFGCDVFDDLKEKTFDNV